MPISGQSGPGPDTDPPLTARPFCRLRGRPPASDGPPTVGGDAGRLGNQETHQQSTDWKIRPANGLLGRYSSARVFDSSRERRR